MLKESFNDTKVIHFPDLVSAEQDAILFLLQETQPHQPGSIPFISKNILSI